MSTDKLDMQSSDLVKQNIEKLAALFPNCVTETAEGKAIDFDLLKQELSYAVVEGRKERYRLEWPGKREAIVTANLHIDKTLRPVREDSVDFDNTENLYIEGDNLEVLKLLQESYMGKVKMIYIDPPYNTGKDFVYKDNFTQDSEEYKTESGQKDEYNRRLFLNPETAGRYHSDWLTMMYPRLKLARNLLREDGLIFISIDDSEVQNLKKICDEIFGEINFVATLVYDKNRKNDAKYFSVGHEYMLVYFKDSNKIFDLQIIYRASKEGIEEVKTEFNRLSKLYNNNWELVNEGLKKLYSSWPKDDEKKPLARFSKVDEKGPYRDDGNISWPGGGGPKYDVIHPKTKRKCKVPDAGWRFPTIERMTEEIEKGRVVFGIDETTLPRIRRNLFEFDKEVMRSVHFSYAQTATVEFNKIFDNKRIFENPKHFIDLKKLLEYVTIKEEKDIVLDFFSGSASFAHAVIQLNAEDEGNRKYIMVQLPESIEESNEAYKAGYKNICEIGKERIRRAAQKIKEETGANIDYGFRVYRLDSSNMQDVYYKPQDYHQSALDLFADNVKPDRTADDLLAQVMLDWGLPLSLKIEQLTIAGKKVFKVADNSLYACFDKGIDEAFAKAIAQEKPLRIVFRDSGFANDTAKSNVKQLLKQLTPETEMKVI
jgi:adenine-specific DNA-methyltransferase